MKHGILITFAILTALLVFVTATAESSEPNSGELSDLKEQAMQEEDRRYLAREGFKDLSEIGTPEAANVVAEILKKRVFSQEVYPADYLIRRVRFEAIPEDSELFDVLSVIKGGHKRDPGLLRTLRVPVETDFHWKDRLEAAGALGWAGYDTTDFLLAAYENPGFLLGKDEVRTRVRGALLRSRTEKAARILVELISDFWAYDLISIISSMARTGNPYVIVAVREILEGETWGKIEEEMGAYSFARQLLNVIRDFGNIDDLQMYERKMNIDDWPEDSEIHEHIEEARMKLLEKEELE